jgi:hypothetical protein
VKHSGNGWAGEEPGSSTTNSKTSSNTASLPPGRPLQAGKQDEAGRPANSRFLERNSGPSTGTGTASATVAPTGHESNRSHSMPSSPPTSPATTTTMAEHLSMLSPPARKTAQRLGQLLVWGYEINEAADLLGLDYEQARLQVAQLQDELERLAGLESTVRHCTKCGEVAPQHLRGMCIGCARSRACNLCGRVEVLRLNLCHICYPENTHPCNGCQKTTRIRRSGLCSRCERETQEVKRAALMADT